FQAEDGIRDFHVTGVQTCALPISDVASGHDAAGTPACGSVRPWRTSTKSKVTRRASPWPPPRRCRGSEALPPPAWRPPARRPARSEERRVGKASGGVCAPQQDRYL